MRRTRAAGVVGSGDAVKISRESDLFMKLGLAQLELFRSEFISLLVQGIKCARKFGHFHELERDKARENEIEY